MLGYNTHMKISKKYIWDYDIKHMDLGKREALLWYLQRKAEHGEWKSLDKTTLKRHLGYLRLNPHLKQIIRGAVSSSK